MHLLPSPTSKSSLNYCLLTALVGAAITIVAFFPGYMSSDSILQYEQARASALTNIREISGFTDLHPPSMGIMWRLLDYIYPGPAGMLTLHNLLYWCGAGLLSFYLFNTRLTQCLSVCLLGFFPPVFALLSTIWKDIAMASSLIFAIAFIVSAIQRWAWYKLVIVTLCLLYALSVRHNAVLAVTPLSLFAAWVIVIHRATRKTQVYAILIGALLATGLGYWSIQQFNKFVTNGKTQYPGQQAQIHDLVGISIAENKSLLPDFLNRPTWNLSDLQKIYTPKTTNIMFCCVDAQRYLDITNVASEYEDLRQKWQTAVQQYPLAYLNHRWGAFKALLGIGETEVCYPFQTEIEPNLYGFTLQKGWFNDGVMAYLNSIKNSPFFRGWIYLLFISSVLVFEIFNPQKFFTSKTPMPISKLDLSLVFLSLSGVLNGSAYFFITLTCDFRYNLWSVIVSLICIVMLISRYMTQKVN